MKFSEVANVTYPGVHRLGRCEGTQPRSESDAVGRVLHRLGLPRPPGRVYVRPTRGVGILGATYAVAMRRNHCPDNALTNVRQTDMSMALC